MRAHPLILATFLAAVVVAAVAGAQETPKTSQADLTDAVGASQCLLTIASPSLDAATLNDESRTDLLEIITRKVATVLGGQVYKSSQVVAAGANCPSIPLTYSPKK